MRHCFLTAGLLILAAVTAAHAQDQTDDSNARPPVTKGDLEIVKHAKKILDSPKKWNRADTRVCPGTAKIFSLYCALEKATLEVSNQFEHRGAAMQEARFVVDQMSAGKDYDHRLMDYNNDPTTTFADIQNVFRLLELRLAKRLAEQPAVLAAAPAGPAKPSPEKDLRVIRRVRELLKAPEAWNHNDPTQSCDVNAVTFSLYCAFDKAQQELTDGHDGAAIQQVRLWISNSAPNGARYQARLVDYNNDPTTKFEDIQNLLRLVENRLTQ